MFHWRTRAEYNRLLRDDDSEVCGHRAAVKAARGLGLENRASASACERAGAGDSAVVGCIMKVHAASEGSP
jgi:hypothetical protein